jgi:hypothetical protein
MLFVLGLSVLSLSGCLTSGDSTATATNSAPSTGNNAPVISGNPSPSVVVGSPFSFTPVASDADGDKLTFSIVNQPDWATFTASTGTLNGTPGAGDVRDYSTIVISASDGQVASSLPAFNISVTQTGIGSVTLAWSPPLQNDDGSALTDLAGYRIYYGTQSGNYSEVIEIDNPGISTYVVQNLPPATYFFSSTAFNQGLVESDYSNEASRLVQ